MKRALVAAIALAAIAAWPVAAWQRSRAAASATVEVPVAAAPRDYIDRDRLIAFYEREMARDPSDQITLRMVASQYMLRFRERGDFGDVERAKAAALRSLQLQPSGNDAADMSAASALLAYHEFHQALRYERDAVAAVPNNDGARAQIASLFMELGAYDRAAATLAHPAGDGNDDTWASVRARYYELTGRLSLARNLIDETAADVDRISAAPAYVRSWYHFRAAQLALEAGDDDAVADELAQSLYLYPNNAAALMVEAQWHRAHGRWQQALEAATRSADLYPLPQALGYKADAQRALGDLSGAQQTDALIDAETRLYNVQGVNDRLLAMYYAQRHVHLEIALRMARSDLQKRGNEIYADDTMAWVLAAQGRWEQARRFAVLATRLDTQDPMLQYHAAVIALETGHTGEGRRRLANALDANPSFDPFYAADARQRLQALQ